MYEVKMTLKIPHQTKTEIAKSLGYDIEIDETREERENYLKARALKILEENIVHYDNLDNLFDIVEIDEEDV